jgi:hypothetical protein
MTAGYSKRTPHKMTGDKECRIVGALPTDTVIFDSCHSPDGFSGGPILSFLPTGGLIWCSAFHVASQVWKGKSIAIAVSAASIWREIGPVCRRAQMQFPARRPLA